MSSQTKQKQNPINLRQALDKVMASHAEQFRAELLPAYERYVDTVSERDVASSLETSVMLMVLCKALSADTVMDLGSGFSSYVFRYYKQKYNPGLGVYSIDTDSYWLDMSRKFSGLHDLSPEGYMLWDDNTRIHDKCDLIFLDIQDYPRRQGYLPKVRERFCHPGTAVLLDDMHWPRYSAAIYETLSGRDYVHLNLKAQTLDQYGRFANLICGLTG